MLPFSLFLRRRFAHLFLTLAAGLAFSIPAMASAERPAPVAVPPLPSFLSPDGPPIPSAPPVEPPHPAVIPLWPGGAPGFEGRRDEPEQITYRQEPDIVFPVIFNIHNPSIVPFLPAPEKATGAAVIIAPGGGFTFLTIGREGYDLARWLADRGVAAFVLKYRLPRDAANRATGAAQPYNVDEHAVADGRRAVRLVRARAAEWGVQPDRIGILGFSAGGVVALRVGTQTDAGNPGAQDPVERQSSRPDFFAPVYTGGFERIPAGLVNAEATPPAFLLCAYDDRMSEDMARFLVALHQAGVSAELHIFSTGGHGWGVRTDRGFSLESWPGLFLGWLKDRGFLRPE